MLELNTKLFDTKGILGRRDFFLSSLYVLMITSPLWLLAFGLSCIPKFVDTEFFSFLIGTLFLSSVFLNLILMIPSLVKRLNDINGQVNKKDNLIFIIALFLLLLLSSIKVFFVIFFLGVCLYLLIKKGKITGLFKYNIEKDFNWGACFGTWIWGIVNKSYKTFWMLPIALTPLGTIFSLICGFKGNEWAIKNRDWESLSEFKESQNTQTVIFVILNLFIMPILIYVIVFILMMGIIIAPLSDMNKNPEIVKTRMEKFDKAMDNLSSFYFESYEISKSGNKFYIYPSIWSGADLQERKKMMDFAANIAVSEGKKVDKIYYENSSKEIELLKTTFYNAKKKDEILAQYKKQSKKYTSDKISLKEFADSIYESYKFYEPTY